MAGNTSAREILEGFWAAERRFTTGETDSMDEMLSWYTSDCQIVQSPDLPYAGVHKGHDGFRKCFDLMGRLYSRIDVKAKNICEDGDTLMVLSESTFQIKGTPDEEAFVAPTAFVIKVDLEQGKISYNQPYYWSLFDFNRRFKEAGLLE